MTNNPSINTLSEFLMQAQTQYMVFDLGRGIRKLDNQVFFEWENQQSPCLYPRQEHGWFCIVFYNEHMSDERFIWFIKLPLDEHGFINQAARNQFLEIIVTALGTQLEHSADKQAQLPENPYVFQPSQQQLADCNAHIKANLEIPSSDPEALQSVLAYLQAPQMQANEDKWTEFTLQNISDLIINPVSGKDSKTLNNKSGADNSSQATCLKAITDNIKFYPTPLTNCIYASLETIPLSDELTQSLMVHHSTIEDPNTSALCLRAISLQPNDEAITYINQIITSKDPLDLETGVVIAGRFWSVLKNELILQRFMEKIVELDDEYSIFRAIYSDLVRIPEIRRNMLTFIHSEEKSDDVKKAFNSLFQS